MSQHWKERITAASHGTLGFVPTPRLELLPASASLRHRGRRRLAWVALALVAGSVGTEAGLRYVLFSDSERAVGLAERWGVRDAGLYGSPDDDDEYWTLRRVFAPTEEMRLNE
ncbi:hypothetical protein Poly30_13160 [Planctomycetes bacterium Poly30]|uniref:Uncharacterized protein n=1 Tax=Saltatorellus ferox TaxID=2528018 RepID=A0A518EP05_9BACT|nr:hypothetical protein Poly30_13160 [Planctomycetes bacterium Poly30]